MYLHDNTMASFKKKLLKNAGKFRNNYSHLIFENHTDNVLNVLKFLEL